MFKRSKTSIRRIKNLVIFCAFIAIIISSSTYAWFIGMQVVNVSSFNIEIASTESLLLSLNGKDWDTTVSISRATLDHVSYENHTNNWGGRGLVPMSSVGEMDADASRMKLYEKASLTSTPGGYRLLASRVDNHTDGKPEQDGYVVFDLFIKNITGAKYYDENDEANEEAIYLTTDSSVTVASDGEKNTGIENSVRVAFAQIGRVAGTTGTQGTITGIKCSGGAGVTGICRAATIWEPNDKLHEANAIGFYNTACKERTKADLTKTDSYGAAGSCMPLAVDQAYSTYAIKDDIAVSDRVDVYDGYYNKYAGSPKLVAHECFTDSDKIKEGMNRPQFMSLAPSSITKVRVYIYLEGQDIDNYDFASIGKKIAVKFGFTKERFNPDDIGYYDEDGATDITPPVITLEGKTEVIVPFGGEYEDDGATAEDNKDESVTVVVTGLDEVDTNEAGIYYIEYNATDIAGNKAAKVIRTVIVEEE